MTDEFDDWTYEEDKLENALRLLAFGLSAAEILAEAGDDADWLRPVLEAATEVAEVQAVMPLPPPDASLTRLLAHSENLRIHPPPPQPDPETSRPSLWQVLRSYWFPRLAMAVGAICLVFALSGGALVRAAQGALPGDLLYSVKRRAEAVQLWLVTENRRDLLQEQLAAERREEVRQLLEQGRQMGFVISGHIESISENDFTIDGLKIQITSSTDIEQILMVGLHVEVSGLIQPPSTLSAWEISSLDADDLLPVPIQTPRLTSTMPPTQTADGSPIIGIDAFSTTTMMPSTTTPTPNPTNTVETTQIQETPTLLVTPTAILTDTATVMPPATATTLAVEATSQETATIIPSNTAIPFAETATNQPPTATPTAIPAVILTETPLPPVVPTPTGTPSSTPVSPTATPVPPTATNTTVPPTATPILPTVTPTFIPSTATPISLTATSIPPTATLIPPTATPIPPTPTPDDGDDDHGDDDHSDDDGDEQEMKGIVQAKPSSNGPGEWRIGGQILIANDDTEYRTDDEGVLEIGTCVQVKYQSSGGQKIATRIRLEELDDCE